MKNVRLMSVALASLTAACSSSVGSLTVTVSGEDAAVEGFDATAFADGWSVEFDTLIVSLSAFDLYADGDHAALETDPVLVDLTDGNTTLWTFEGVPAQRWSDVRYRLAPPTAGSRDVGSVDATLRQRMIDQGLSVLVIGTATRDAVTRDFDFGFTMDVAHSRCQGADETDGIIVASGAANEAQITLHWDHLFFDSLSLDEAEMRFEAIAAANDGSAPITLEALSSQRLADLRGLDGEPLVGGDGAPIVYDPGSAALGEPTLRAMVEAAATTVGHLDGEGHCEYTAQ